MLRASETYTSAVGPVTVTLTLYRAGRGKAMVPLELRAGIVEGHWTPLAARQGSFLVAHLTPHRARCRLGSGVIEATCKTLAMQRMKRSGMRWRHIGGQAILTLRALAQSNRFEQAWDLLSATYRTDVSLPDNVIELPRTRAA